MQERMQSAPRGRSVRLGQQAWADFPTRKSARVSPRLSDEVRQRLGTPRSAARAVKSERRIKVERAEQLAAQIRAAERAAAMHGAAEQAAADMAAAAARATAERMAAEEAAAAAAAAAEKAAARLYYQSAVKRDATPKRRWRRRCSACYPPFAKPPGTRA